MATFVRETVHQYGGGMTPATLNLEFTAGDGYVLTLTFQDSDGNALDVSAYTHRAQIRARYSSTDCTAFAIDDTSATTGVLRMPLTAVQTRALGQGVYRWDYERQASGEDPQTLFAGTVLVRPDVTREES